MARLSVADILLYREELEGVLANGWPSPEFGDGELILHGARLNSAILFAVLREEPQLVEVARAAEDFAELCREIQAKWPGLPSFERLQIPPKGQVAPLVLDQAA